MTGSWMKILRFHSKTVGIHSLWICDHVLRGYYSFTLGKLLNACWPRCKEICVKKKLTPATKRDRCGFANRRELALNVKLKEIGGTIMDLWHQLELYLCMCGKKVL